MTTSIPTSDGPTLSIIIGLQQGQKNLPAILEALKSDTHPEVEVLLCHARDDPLSVSYKDGRNLRVIVGKEDALIPHLWRDGIVAANSDRVALLTAHCVPNEDWLDTLQMCDLDQFVAVGGVIANSLSADGVGVAIHLLRYSGFAGAQTAHEVSEIAADNAVYRRSEILACTDLLELGFWEPSYHARFRAKGLTMQFRPDLCVVHTNQYSPRAFMRQRRRHGRAFGRERGIGEPFVKRMLLVLSSPLAFLVHAVKLTARILGSQDLRPTFFRAAPWFYLFMMNWNWGETVGYWDALLERRGPEITDRREGGA